MAASQEQKVDYLLKKIGYVASKTGIAEDSSLSGTKKAPFGEAIPSPLVVPATNIWSDSSLIPATPPGSTGTTVQVYLTGTSGHRMTADSTISGNRTFIAYSTYNNSSTAILGDWIDTSFGADYIVKVYKGDPNSGGVQLSAAGSGSNDTWFFDYSSGVLNFNGTSVPSGVTSSNIYIVGYRYIGGKGAQPVAGFSTFSSLNVSGISTLNALNVTGIATFGHQIDANGRIVGIQTNSVIPFYYDQVSDFPSASTYHGAFAHAHNTGRAYFAHAGWKELVNRESNGLVGTGTEGYNVGVVTGTRFSTGAIGTGINIGVGSITGPSEIIIDPAVVGANSGTVRIAGDLQVDGTTVTLDTVVTEVDRLEVGANNNTVGAAITQSGTGDILNLYDGSTEVFSVEDGGRVVATATNNVIPFLYANYSDLPSASTYHGAFAHVHSTGSAYYAHANNWYELVRKELTGIVGTGTETYNVAKVIGFDYLAAPYGATTTFTVTVADKVSGEHRYHGQGSSKGYVFDGQQAPFITLTPGRTYRFDQSDNSNATHQIKFYLEADKTTLYEGGVTYNGTAGSSGAYTQIVVGDETPTVLHYMCVNHGYMGNAAQVNSNVVNTNYEATLRGNLSVTGISTFTGEIDSNGRIVGVQTNNVIPFYYDQVSDFPSAATYHGAVAHAHNTGRLYFAHAGWKELVNKEADGTVGTGSEAYRVGIITATTGDFVDIDVDGQTELDDLNVAGVSTFIGAVTFNGDLDLQDNDKILLGTGDDLEIFHDGTDSRIDNNTGDLYVETTGSGDDILIQSADDIFLNPQGGENGVNIIGNGAVELYHDNSKKLETTATGIDVTGNTETDDLTVTGTAYLNGTVSAASSTGAAGQVLQSTGVGVTWATTPATRTSQTFTAAEDQTTFSFNYTVGLLDVFYNGVKLASSEFTANNGTSVVLGDVAYAGDIIELISYNTITAGSGGGGASSLNALADVSIVGTAVIGESLTHNGSEFVNDFTTSLTTTATTQVPVLSLDLSVYRSVEYQIQVTEGSKFHTTKILAIHNGTAAVHNEFGTLSIGTVPATFDVDISGSNLRLLATPASSNSTVFKVKFTAIKV